MLSSPRLISSMSAPATPQRVSRLGSLALAWPTFLAFEEAHLRFVVVLPGSRCEVVESGNLVGVE
jgi:hypothetical protein